VRIRVPTFPGSWTPSSTSTGAPRPDGKVGQRPAPGLDDRDDALRRVGAGQLFERPRGQLFDGNGTRGQRGEQGRAARRGAERRGHDHPCHAHVGREGFFHHAHAFGQRQRATPPSFALL
jgi:hypothetical protein